MQYPVSATQKRKLKLYPKIVNPKVIKVLSQWRKIHASRGVRRGMRVIPLHRKETREIKDRWDHSCTRLVLVDIKYHHLYYFVCKTLTVDVNTTSEIGYLKLHDGMEKKDTRRLRMEV